MLLTTLLSYDTAALVVVTIRFEFGIQMVHKAAFRLDAAIALYPTNSGKNAFCVNEAPGLGSNQPKAGKGRIPLFTCDFHSITNWNSIGSPI